MRSYMALTVAIGRSPSQTHPRLSGERTKRFVPPRYPTSLFCLSARTLLSTKLCRRPVPKQEQFGSNRLTATALLHKLLQEPLGAVNLSLVSLHLLLRHPVPTGDPTRQHPFSSNRWHFVVKCYPQPVPSAMGCLKLQQYQQLCHEIKSCRRLSQMLNNAQHLLPANVEPADAKHARFSLQKLSGLAQRAARSKGPPGRSKLLARCSRTSFTARCNITEPGFAAASSVIFSVSSGRQEVAVL
jgi:hypothetical protein